MTPIRLPAAVLFLLISIPSHADLDSARAEKNLEKRSQKALENAESALKAANRAYEKGQWEEAQGFLSELQESVEFSYSSLKDTGKDPRRSPKHFKRAEIKTRDLLRHMGDFRDRMAVEDRQYLDKVRDRVQEIHDELLLGIMGREQWGKL